MSNQSKSPYVYLRSLRLAEHTVFCVADGQKTYYDPRFGKEMPYSSGQQVKRSLLLQLVSELGLKEVPITFNFEVDEKSKKVKNGEPWNPCDPEYIDQLLGGYMKAAKDTMTIKRRSPLSISAMRPLHPLLVNTKTEDVTFDRSQAPSLHKLNIRMGGKEISLQEAKQLLSENMRDLSPRTWIGDGLKTATGLFVYDVAIDLRRLFCVSNSIVDPEITDEVRKKLTEQGWVEGKNEFGPTLEMPTEKRPEVIKALAKALIHWQITSNQARTYSPMPTLAIAIGTRSDEVTAAIRARLQNDTGYERAKPVIDRSVLNQGLFVTPMAEQEIANEQGSSTAIRDAEAYLERLISNYFEE